MAVIVSPCGRTSLPRTLIDEFAVRQCEHFLYSHFINEIYKNSHSNNNSRRKFFVQFLGEAH